MHEGDLFEYNVVVLVQVDGNGRTVIAKDEDLLVSIASLKNESSLEDSLLD